MFSHSTQVKNMKARDCLPQIENSRKWQGLCRLEGASLPACTHRRSDTGVCTPRPCTYACSWFDALGYNTHTHTSNPVATHSLPAWRHVWAIDLRGSGAATRGELKWVEGDRNYLQLGLAQMHSLSITLSRRFVFARRQKEFFRDTGCLDWWILQSCSCLFDLI